jgi:solute carrier family 40 (iron-regulated transporter), member 1
MVTGGRAQSLALEQDWVVVLSRSSTQWLGGTNAALRRIDLTCDMLAPAAVGGFLSAVSGVQYTAVLIAALNVLSVAVEYASMQWLHAQEPALSSRATTATATTAGT